MSVAYHSLTKIITDAKDLGVTDKPLAPLEAFIDRNKQLTELLDTIEKRNHVADAFTNGTDLAAALKAEADDQAIYARATAHSTALTDLVGGAMLDLVDDPKQIDPLLAALSNVLQPAQSALNKITERWGSENPDAAVVAAEATPTELKEYRARGTHAHARKRVYAILDRLHATTAGYGEGKFPMVLVPTGGLPDQVLRYWLITDDGAVRSQQHARAKVNAFRTLEELSRHDDVRTNPKPPFIAKYAVHPDRIADATFDRNGAPTNPDDLMTPDEYYLLFGTTANDDQAAQSRNSGAVNEYMAELNNRKDN